MDRVQADMTAQAQDAVSLAIGFARTDDRVFIQSTVTAAIHMAKAHDSGHTCCGWRYFAARKKGSGSPHRIVDSIATLPGCMICERCMPTEPAVAMQMHDADPAATNCNVQS